MYCSFSCVDAFSLLTFLYESNNNQAGGVGIPDVDFDLL